MSDGYSIYTGSATSRGPDGSAAPAIGVAPQVWIQADGYTITSATSFQQPIEVLANNVTFLLDGYGSYNNTATFKALQIDGVGGNVPTVPAGDLYVSGATVIGGATTVDGYLTAVGNITGDGYVTAPNGAFATSLSTGTFVATGNINGGGALTIPGTFTGQNLVITNLVNGLIGEFGQLYTNAGSTLTLATTLAAPTKSFHLISSSGVVAIKTIPVTNFTLSTSVPILILYDPNGNIATDITGASGGGIRGLGISTGAPAFAVIFMYNFSSGFWQTIASR